MDMCKKIAYDQIFGPTDVYGIPPSTKRDSGPPSLGPQSGWPESVKRLRRRKNWTLEIMDFHGRSVFCSMDWIKGKFTGKPHV